MDREVHSNKELVKENEKNLQAYEELEQACNESTRAYQDPKDKYEKVVKDAEELRGRNTDLNKKYLDKALEVEGCKVDVLKKDERILGMDTAIHEKDPSIMRGNQAIHDHKS